MKVYFFRDLGHNENLEDGKSYHAAGIVDRLFCEIGKPNYSGKDLSVSYVHPFNFTVQREWRSLKDVELFMVEQHEYDCLEILIRNYEDLQGQNQQKG